MSRDACGRCHGKAAIEDCVVCTKVAEHRAKAQGEERMIIYESRCIAIETRYLGPTNIRGSRYKAFTESGRSVTLHAADNLSSQENHRAAARALCVKMGWEGDLLEGGAQRGYVYVFLPRGMSLRGAA